MIDFCSYIKFVVRCEFRWITAALTLQDCIVYINPSERLHIMNACGSETFWNTPPSPRSLTLAKPAAQQMMVGDVPEERKVGMGRFFMFWWLCCWREQILWYINERTSGRNLSDGERVRNGIKKVKMRCLSFREGCSHEEGQIFVWVCEEGRGGDIATVFA